MTILENISLKPFNTFGIEAKARFFAEFESVEDLKYIFQKIGNQKWIVLGGGSNMLFTKDFDGWVIKNNIKGKSEENSKIYKIGAGEVWHEFVMFCVKHNLKGLENLSLIPGTVGAAPIQNIGAYGVEQKDCFVKLVAFNVETFETKTFTKEECRFGYRDSIFKQEAKGQFIITEVYYQFQENASLNISYGDISKILSEKNIDRPTIKDVSDAVISIRQSKLPDPKEIGNGGSFFKNPVVSVELYNNIKADYPEVPSYPSEKNTVKVPAGWLIEKAGFKGMTVGNVGVHAKQALVLVNYGNGTGQEIFNLSETIIETIKSKFRIELEREVNII